MPLKTFNVPDRKDPSKEFAITRYVIDKSDAPTAVVFGKFSPWTGKGGHGTVLKFAKSKFKNVIIVSPLREKTESGGKYGANIFTPQQRGEIVQKATGETFMNVKTSIPIRMFTQLLEHGIQRPVFIVGEDREKEFKKMFIPYKKGNESVTDPAHKDFGKGEMAINRFRGTSGTKVRKALVDGDRKTFLKETGYKDDMYEYMRQLLKKNKVVESYNHWMR